MDLLITCLEWSGFGGVLISTWLYGYDGPGGGIVGFASALTLVIYGSLTGVAAIAITNIIFMGIHWRNVRRADAKQKAAIKFLSRDPHG